MQKKATAVECDALNGDGTAWAVVDGDGYTIYETQFCEATAKELALLCDSMPRATWERHRQVLERMGCDLRDPAEVSNPEPFLLAEVWGGFPRVMPVAGVTRCNRMDR